MSTAGTGIASTVTRHDRREHAAFRVRVIHRRPNFLRRGQWAYLGWGLASRRRTSPALSVEELPPLDAVLLSHLHGDDFDRVARRGLDRRPSVLTTPHAALRVEALPGVHRSWCR